ncbi:MAG: transporter substrate-binding domain-containing protein [Clostridia bacterium]|nr:transporter substrate-binding domain-containing protein [Clostridia bacterium]
MKKIFALVLAMLMMFSFAACGGNTTPETTDPATGSDAATDTAAKETVVVGYTIYEPMNYLDENGKLVGFDTELAEAVFGNLGYEVIFQEIEWSSKYTDLDSGTIDCVWNGFTANTADDDGVMRADKVDFSYNYMENRQVVVVKADSGIATAADLSGKFGVAESGSAGEAYAKEFEGVNFKGFIKQTECLTEISAGTADFAVVDAQLAKSYVGKGDYADLAIVEELSSDVEFYAIGFKKGSLLTANVNAQLEALAADGTISALAEKYGVANTAITDFSDQK